MEDGLVSLVIESIKNNPFVGIVVLISFLWLVFNYSAFYLINKENLSYKRSIEWIKQNTFAKRYLYLLNYILSYISKLIGDEKEFINPKPTKNTPKWMKKLFGFNPFTTASYRAMLILALSYPILSLYITWWLSGNNKISEFMFAPNIDSIYIRCIIVLVMLIFIRGIFIIASEWINLLNKKITYTKKIIFLVYFIVFISVFFNDFSATLIGFMTTEHGGNIEFNRIISIRIAIVIFIINFGIMVIVYTILKNKLTTSYIFWLVYTIFALAIGFLFIVFFKQSNTLILILFFSLLPILNAILDWISLGFTRGLLTSIISGHHKTKDALLWAFLDLLLAVVFLVLISLGMIALVGISNHLSGTTIYDLNEIFTNLKNGDIKQNFWIYFMMFSTLLPTLLHFILAILSLLMWLPDSWRKELIKDIQNDQHRHILAFLYLTFTPIIAIAVVLFLCWEGYKLLDYLFTQTDIGSFLLDIAQNTYNIFL